MPVRSATLAKKFPDLRICLDTGFFIALCDPRDATERRAKADNCYSDWVSKRNRFEFVVLWPVLHETLSTRFTSNPQILGQFQRCMLSLRKHQSLIFLDDVEYREKCLDMLMTPEIQRRFSLVDLVLREVMCDPNVKIDALFSFNPRDFTDICRKRHLSLLPY